MTGLALAAALVTPVAADDGREARIFAAIVEIHGVQISAGPDRVIERIKACYRDHARIGAGMTPALESCIAQDIATAFYINSLPYHGVEIHDRRDYTEYLATEDRIDEALALAGLDEQQQAEVMRIIGSLALGASNQAMAKARELAGD